MYTYIFLIVAVCVKIQAFSEDCTQEIELNNEIYGCCVANDQKRSKYLEDPCFKNAEEKQLNSIECVADCLYKDHNLIMNDSIVMDNVNKYSQALIPDDAKRNRFIDAAEACNKLGKANIFKIFGHLNRASECWGYNLLFDYCTLHHELSRCPEEVLTKSKYCRSQAKLLNECIFNKIESE